ncbi:MAG: ATP-binding cassette domain-containing protein, partial [Steroidobacteraceae bacterium]
DAELREVERKVAALEALGDAADGSRLAELYAHYATIGGYDARARGARLMNGLGFQPADEARAVREFSGGWRVRLNVAKALMCRSDVLLLDEPTNHLDLDAILWLETWLRDYPGTLMLIAHDREFLDRIVDRIVHLEHGKAVAYRGNYSAFETQRAAQLAEQSALHARQQREVRHMQSFIDRFRASATKARQAQSRIKALERMQLIAPAHVDSPFAFSFAEPDKLPRPLLAIEEQQAGYAGKPIVSKFDLTVYPGDRIGLLGRNGAGKSTVMKLLAGELAATAGTRTDARDLRIGYFAQHQLEQLVADESPVENLRRVALSMGNRNVTEQELRDYLATFGFRGDRVFEPVAPFSGGEKARLVLALVAWRRPNLLLLDEPTNHLDLEMRQALAMALQDYAGAVIMVSHDRHLMRTVSDRFLLVHDGRARDFDGDLDDYAAWLATANSPTAPAAAPKPVAARAAPAPRLKPLQTEVARCEKRMGELSTELAALDTRLASPETHAPGAHDALRALGDRRSEVAAALEAAENAWLEASESLERLQAASKR